MLTLASSALCTICTVLAIALAASGLRVYFGLLCEVDSDCSISLGKRLIVSERAGTTKRGQGNALVVEVVNFDGRVNREQLGFSVLDIGYCLNVEDLLSQTSYSRFEVFDGQFRFFELFGLALLFSQAYSDKHPQHSTND